jgi:hypothetical protein
MKLIKYVACLSVVITSQAIPQTTRQTGSYLKQATISEVAGMIHITANSPRPLAQTLDALQQKYGWVVGYEDPQFISRLDLVDTADPVSHTPNANLPPWLPGGGPFTVEFPASSPEEQKTLQIVVDSYNQSDNPGRFEIRKGRQDSFSVVGAEARDARGQLSHQRVLFDEPLTIATRQRTVSDTVNLICHKVARQRRVTVTVGVSPRNLMDHTAVTVGGTKVSARDFLLQTLTSTHRNLYWRLLFDPDSKGYFLDIHLLRTSP